MPAIPGETASINCSLVNLRRRIDEAKLMNDTGLLVLCWLTSP
jgi:hypothetical protein